MRTSSPLHAVTWSLWAVAAAAAVQLAPNPLYVSLVIAASFVVVSAHRIDTTLARAFPVLISLGVAFAVLRVALTALTTHDPSGSSPDTWFTLPQFTLPRLLGGFTVGGSIEGVVVLTAASQAFAVVGIMAAFGAFNAVASHHELLQATPRAFHEPGLIVTVALAFVPSTMQAVAAAREADLARTGGRAVRRGRLLRTAVPIVESGLERAMALAESMDARGFARHAQGTRDRVAGWLGFASMLALGGAFVALVGRASGWAVVAAVIGVIGLAAAVVSASRASGPTRYRPRKLTTLDGVMIAVALATPAGLAVLRSAGHSSLVWWPSPIHFPELSIWPTLLIALLAAPAAIPPVAAPPVGAPPAGSSPTGTDARTGGTGPEVDAGAVASAADVSSPASTPGGPDSPSASSTSGTPGGPSTTVTGRPR